MMEKERTQKNYEDGVPIEDLKRFVRGIYPLIQAYYESEEGKRDFAAWKEKTKRDVDKNVGNR